MYHSPRSRLLSTMEEGQIQMAALGRSRVRGWLHRYLPPELVGTTAALLAALALASSGLERAVIAAAWAEAIAFYAYVTIREFRRHAGRRASAARAPRGTGRAGGVRRGRGRGHDPPAAAPDVRVRGRAGRPDPGCDRGEARLGRRVLRACDPRLRVPRAGPGMSALPLAVDPLSPAALDALFLPSPFLALDLDAVERAYGRVRRALPRVALALRGQVQPRAGAARPPARARSRLRDRLADRAEAALDAGGRPRRACSSATP